MLSFFSTALSPRRWLRVVGVLAGYGALFAAFDVQAAFFEVAPGVSPWYASAGLNLALLVVFGLRYLPAVLVATLLSGFLISEPPIAWYHLLGPNLAVVVGQGVAAAWLRSRFAAEDPVSLRSVGWLVAVALGLPVFVAAASVASYTLTGLEGYSWARLPEIALSWWRGDAIGLLTLTPLLFWSVAPHTREWRAFFEPKERLATPRRPRALAEAAGQAVAVAAALYFAFPAPDGPFHYYLCFLPLLWVALRHGLPRATLVIFLTNLGAVLAFASLGAHAPIFSFQLFMIALALTGLLLGALVSERHRAVRSLRQTHRRLEEHLRDALQHRTAPSEKPLPEEAPAPPTVAMRIPLYRRIVQLREAQAQLADAGARLRDINDRKDEFFSLISHDLKNLIFSSVCISEMLMEDASTLSRSQIHEFAGHLSDSSQRTYDLLDSLLQWAQMQTGRMPHQPERITARAFVNENLLQIQEAAQRKEITLRSDVPERLHIWADPRMADTVLRNLLGNAVKYTGAGGSIHVTVRRGGLEADSQPVTNASVAFAVADTGTGIQPDRLATLFRIGEGHSTPGTDAETGTGLGLLLCKEMVEEHDERLWVESTPGEGSTFSFTLPHASTAPDPQHRLAPASVA